MTIDLDRKIFFYVTKCEARDVTGEHISIDQVKDGFHDADVALRQFLGYIFVSLVLTVHVCYSIQILQGAEFNVREALRIVPEDPADQSSKHTTEQRADESPHGSQRTKDKCADL